MSRLQWNLRKPTAGVVLLNLNFLYTVGHQINVFLHNCHSDIIHSSERVK